MVQTGPIIKASLLKTERYPLFSKEIFEMFLPASIFWSIYLLNGF